MAAPVPGADISVKPAAESDATGLGLLIGEDGAVAFERSTISLLPTSAPPGAATPETFPAPIQIEYEISGAELGVGRTRFRDGSRVAGLSKGVDTRFEEIFLPGPKVNYIGDIDILAGGGDFEDFTGGIPDGWAKINGTETTTEETTIVDDNNGSTSSAKVVSGASGDGITEVLVHGEYAQCVITLTGSVFVPNGDSPATMRIHTNIGDTDVASTLTGGWQTFEVEVTVGAAVLSALTLLLMPTNGDTAYFDNLKFQITKLTGPAASFWEEGGEFFHASGRTVWKLATHWKAQDVAAQNIKSVVLHGALAYSALGGSTNWESSSDGSTWTPNSTAANNDRFADGFAVTFSRAGFPVLWKFIQSNKLAASTNPDGIQWIHHRIGSSDANIIGLTVVENVLIIIKEDGVWNIGLDGIPRNMTPDWGTSRSSSQGLGAASWLGRAYIPASRQSLWEFEVSPERASIGARRPMHPAVFGADAKEYQGKITAIIGDGGWLYAFLQDPTDVSVQTAQMMVGRPFQGGWRWGHLAEIDAGRVDATWITEIPSTGPRLYFGSRDTDVAAAASVPQTKSVGTGVNTDNSSGTAWANPSNVSASDDSDATLAATPNTGALGSNVEAVIDYDPGLAWADEGNAAAADDAYATATFAVASSTKIAGTAVSSGSGTAWTNPDRATANDGSRVTIVFGGSETLSEDLDCDNFGFAIPSDATITGIRVDIMEASALQNDGNNFVHDWSGGTEVFLLKAGTPDGDNHAGTTIWTNTSWPSAGTHSRQFPTHASHHADGSSHTWGNSPALTPADINDADFGCRIVVRGKSTTGSFDYVQMVVWYEVAESDGLRVTDFTGISLPSDAVIDGIEVVVHRKSSVASKVADSLVRLVKAGTLAGDDKKDVGTWWPTTEATATYGGASDLWGTTWSKAQVEAAGFGVEIRCDRADTTAVIASVDYISINVYYTANAESDYLDVDAWGFTIPSGATIDGITVSIERSQSGGHSSVKDAVIQLLDEAGSVVGSSKALTLTAWPSSDTVQEYGGPTDTWGWSGVLATEINDDDWGVRISVTSDQGADTAAIDHVEITVWYSPASGSELDNRLGWVDTPTTENPRHSTDYDFADDVTIETGIMARFPGWETSWHEVRLFTSPDTDEVMGSGGRQAKVQYDLRDGNGFVDLGGSGNGIFTTSPKQVKFFKQTGSAGIKSDEINVKLELETGDSDTKVVVEKMVVVGAVRPITVTVYEFTVLVTDNAPALIGHTVVESDAVLSSLRALSDPDSPFELYDREGSLHYCLIDPNGGYRERDVMHFPLAPGEGKATKSVSIRCFEVPNSSSWVA